MRHRLSVCRRSADRHASAESESVLAGGRTFLSVTVLFAAELQDGGLAQHFQHAVHERAVLLRGRPAASPVPLPIDGVGMVASNAERARSPA